MERLPTIYSIRPTRRRLTALDGPAQLDGTFVSAGGYISNPVLPVPHFSSATLSSG